MFELLTMIKKVTSNDTSPPGQMSYRTPGTYQWTVPDDVVFVHAAVLGPGRSFANGHSGNGYAAGGALVYQNNIPVTPGSVLTIVVGDPTNKVGASSFAGLVAGMFDIKTVPPKAVGFNGGRGGYTNISGYAEYGGGAGEFTKNGTSGTGNNLERKSVEYPYGWDSKFLIVKRCTALEFPLAGVGQSRYYPNIAPGPAGPGLVRLIWGPGRAFPATNIDNVTV